ncbi:golgin subfamily A member 6-like protein 22 [Montipora capricornis]|uniref:golgin subfamily A member 6-like protein 22 n=1 Tax=Montipora foliosa TaxID=591990 RepID=UPI0035F1550F
MEWSDEHDVLLCREILTTEPFKAKRRTPQRGQLWQSVADHLNCIPEPKFKVSKRAVRERFTLLAEKFKKKMKAEEKASGIDTEMSELDVLLEEIVEKEEEFDKDQSEHKAKEDQSKAEAYDMRLKAMESLKESKKRRSEEDEKQLPKKKRGSEALDYLREKMDGDKYLREKEFEIKVKEQERDEQRQKLAEDQHKDMMAMMNRQQQEMQQMQMRFFEQQQQQNNLLLALFQKALTK